MEPRKPPRNVELRNMIENAGRVLKVKLAEAKKAADAARYDALVDSTRACGANDKLRKAQMSGVLAVRDAKLRAAEKEYKLALQKAESDRHKARNEAVATFEKGRDECEAEMVAKNAPHREVYAKDIQEIDADLENTIKEINASHDKFATPLLVELETLMEAARAKAEAQEKKTAEATP